jgi:hypothetical protein
LVVWNILFFHNIWDNSCYISITQLYMELLLIGGLEVFSFFHILGIIIPTDFHIFQRGR